MSEPGTSPAEHEAPLAKRMADVPDDDTSPAKRIKQTREEYLAARRAEKEQRESERRAEKEQREAEKRLEKERKEAERKAEKEKKEAERRLEKERKEAEKAAEKERKEAEKAAEKERKEAERKAEKQRKLKAQPRINLFFKQSEPKAPEAHAVATPERAADPEASEDYRTQILPFHTKLDGQLFNSVCNYEHGEEEPGQDPVEWLKSLAPAPPAPRLSTLQFRSKLALAQESSQVATLLAQLRIRRLQFSQLSSRHIENTKLPVNEEYRPPYVGTTRDLDAAAISLLAIDPFRTDLDSSLNYEYDSEAEWDREDGDDLRDDDGDDSDEDIDDSEEMTGFLSTDEDDPSTANRRNFVGPLTPVVIWGQEDLAPYSVEWLAPMPLDPMNPFGESAPALSGPKASSAGAGAGAGGGAGAAATSAADASPQEVVSSITAKVGFDSLKQCMVLVNGNQANKTLLIELMKQQLPSATEKEVRSVLDKCAERVGKKKAEKRWVVRSDACSIFGIESAAPAHAQQSNLSQRNLPGLSLGQQSMPQPQSMPPPQSSASQSSVP